MNFNIVIIRKKNALFCILDNDMALSPLEKQQRKAALLLEVSNSANSGMGTLFPTFESSMDSLGQIKLNSTLVCQVHLVIIFSVFC